MNSAILLISCSDQKGITAQVSNFIYKNNGNIEHADQHIDSQTNTFFMRIEWSIKDFRIPKNKIASEFSKLASKFNMKYQLSFSSDIARAAIFVSQHTHCLYDLLLRQKEGQLRCTFPLIISNHPDAKKIAANFKIKFYQFKAGGQNKQETEKKIIALLKKEKIDLIVLARYQQILSRDFVDTFANRIINIHHSFLPAFVGENPYGQAYRRGVKIIGATSHYVIEELDAGPIIEQDTAIISHRDSLDDLKMKGCDLEKIVLGRAVRLHLDRKILVYNNKTVIFD
jgi:formyltetrahydrofolate deformylase